MHNQWLFCNFATLRDYCGYLSHIQDENDYLPKQKKTKKKSLSKDVMQMERILTQNRSASSFDVDNRFRELMCHFHRQGRDAISQVKVGKEKLLNL